MRAISASSCSIAAASCDAVMTAFCLCPQPPQIRSAFLESRPQRIVSDGGMAVDGKRAAGRELRQLPLQDLHAIAIEHFCQPCGKALIEGQAIGLDVFQRAAC